TKLIQKQWFVLVMGQRSPLTTNLHCVSMELHEETPTDVNLTRLAPLGAHTATILRLEMNPNVSLRFAGLVGIEDIGQGKRCDFFPPQPSMKTQADHHSVMRILCFCQQRLNLVHAEKFGQHSVLHGHDVVHQCFSTIGSNVS